MYIAAAVSQTHDIMTCHERVKLESETRRVYSSITLNVAGESSL